jgi:alkane 1-monooxygenase
MTVMNRELKYALPVIVLPLIVALPIIYGGYWSFFTVLFAFGFIPLVELFISGSTDNLTKEQEQEERKKRYYDFLLYGLVPTQFALVFLYCWRVSALDLMWYEYAGMTMALGVACGVIGINLGHELGHRSKTYEQNLSKALLLSSMYMHFFIEHNRGHHKNIATPLDPATSRLNEPIYKFYIRTIRDSWFSAWELEQHRLNKMGKPFFSWENHMLRYQVYQLSFVLLIFAVFSITGPQGVLSGAVATIGFLLAATVGFLLLETVNYIEHYGLLRKEISPGRYEKVKPHHSWNSNHTLGRLLLFELTRHSDHHYNSGRKYQILRHFDDAPHMPTGYPGMMIAALIPPLWFKIMNKQVEKHKTMFNEAYVQQLEEPAEFA